VAAPQLGQPVRLFKGASQARTLFNSLGACLNKDRQRIGTRARQAPRRSEPGFRRPVLVVRVEAVNRSRLRTVLAVVLTSADNASNPGGPPGPI